MKLFKKSLLHGVLILAFANFFERFLGFVYRVLLSRIIGPQGLGLFHLVFPFYIICVTLTTSGIPVAISYLVAERKALGDNRGIRQIISAAIIIVIVLGLIVSGLLILNIHTITLKILGDTRTQGAIFILSPCIIIVGLACILKGYFYGINDTPSPAMAGIIEQIVRIGLVLTLLYYLPLTNIQEAVAVVCIGTVVGELTSLLFLHYRYRKSKRNILPSSPSSIKIPSYIKSIIKIAAPITLIRFLASLANSAVSILVPQRLWKSGMTKSQGVEVYGILSGMVIPLLYLPFTLTSALSVVIIPNISESIALKGWSNAKEKISKAILFTCLTAFPAAALLFSLGNPIGVYLYKQPLAGVLLIPLTYSMPFHSLQHTLGAILYALEKQNRVFIHFLISSTIQIICTYFLVAQPYFGIYGFIIGFIISDILTCLLHFKAVIHVTKLKIDWIGWFLKPGAAALLMTITAKLSFKLLAAYELPILASLILSSVGGLTVFTIAILFRSIHLPSIHKFIKSYIDR